MEIDGLIFPYPHIIYLYPLKSIETDPIDSWHGHNCHLFKWPTTRPKFWETKINRNKEVDKRNYQQLKKDGWFILTIWECAIKGKTRRTLEEVIAKSEHWLLYESRDKQIKGYK